MSYIGNTPPSAIVTASEVASGIFVTTSASQTFTLPQRGSITTDNDLSFDLNVGNNFKCTTANTGTLTFTNLVAGQSGYIFLDNTAGYAISKAAAVLCSATFLGSISVTGKYLISYFTDGTNVICTSSGVLS